MWDSLYCLVVYIRGREESLLQSLSAMEKKTRSRKSRLRLSLMTDSVCIRGREESLLQTLSAMEAERGVTGFRTTQDNLEKVVAFMIFYSIALQRTSTKNCEANIPRKGIARPRPQSQFPHSRVCERFIYYHRRSAYSASGNMTTDPGEYI